jgi:hypothetical protein
MSKQRESKLDQYAGPLADMEAEKKTLAEMLTWLKAEGVRCSASTLSRFLESARQSRLQEKLLAQIASGAEQCAAVEKSFGKNPAPELETLIKLQRVLILNLSTQATADPELIKLISQSFSSVMDAERLRLKRGELDLNSRKVVLMEKKAEAYDRAQAALNAAKTSKGGITKETLQRIEQELNLL